MAARVKLSAHREGLALIDDRKLVFRIAVFGAGVVLGLVVAAFLQSYF